MTQDELDQSLEQFKEQFGERPRYLLGDRFFRITSRTTLCMCLQ